MITLEKAIETQTAFLETRTIKHFDNLPEATRLGIEAMKEVKRRRRVRPPYKYPPLPGETRE